MNNDCQTSFGESDVERKNHATTVYFCEWAIFCNQCNSITACNSLLRQSVQHSRAVAVEYSSEKHYYNVYNYCKAICQFLDVKAF